MTWRRETTVAPVTSNNSEVAVRAGAIIRGARHARGWSQAQLAARTGFTRSSIANLEAGRQGLTLTTFAVFVQALGLDPAVIIALVPLPPEPPEPPRVKVVRLYQARCASCEWTPVRDSRGEAEADKRQHLAEHQRGELLDARQGQPRRGGSRQAPAPGGAPERGTVMPGKEFSVTRIEFDDDETILEVTATATGAALTLIREVIGEVRWEVAAEREMAVFLPVADMLWLYRDISERTRGTDPAYEQAHAIWESLNWVYCSLIDGGGE